MEDRIFVFAWNKQHKNYIPYVGYYDGQQFHPKHFDTLEELREYDYVELMGPNGVVAHYTKQFTGDLLQSMRKAFISQYGDQIELF